MITIRQRHRLRAVVKKRLLRSSEVPVSQIKYIFIVLSPKAAVMPT